MRLDADVEATYLAALDVLVHGIATGLFPAQAPEDPDFAWVQCPYCNPDGSATARRGTAGNASATIRCCAGTGRPRRTDRRRVMTDDAVGRRRRPATGSRHDTAATLFVEAGAGSGKTKSLVDRVLTLVLRDGVPLTSIAAVTFTEKAGAELRDRLRAAFEAVWLRPDTRADRTRASRRCADLDRAAIGTLHSFAQRILSSTRSRPACRR